LLAAALTGNSDPVLLEFTADWCVHCRTMGPTIERLREAGYPVEQIDVDRSPDVARQYGVRPIPCYVLVQNGREIDRVVGAASYDRLLELFSRASIPPATHEGSPLRSQSPDAPMSSPRQREAVAQASPSNIDSRASSQARTAGVSTAADTAQRRALEATVRLTVVDSTGQSHGTGTIIDTHGPEALIVTCGHIFRESRGNGEIHVDLFAPGSKGPVRGELIAYESEQRDVGLVSIRPGVPVRPMPVAPPNHRPQAGDSVFSVGCDHGADPTVRPSTISAVDRYEGPPNLEIHGHPVQGRSGGGLFSADGWLIGVCNAADLQEDRGIYAALPTIYLELKQIGQERIYLEPHAQPLDPVTPVSPARPAEPTVLVGEFSSSSQPQTWEGDVEVICILRPRGAADGERRVMVVDRPSKELIQLIGRESHVSPDRHVSAPNEPTRADAGRGQAPPYARQPIVRAQGY
jgi:thiol-disulfide isomerase/thioredoxin